MAGTFMAPNFNAGSGASSGPPTLFQTVCQHRSSASAPTEADARRPNRPPRFTIAGERGDDHRRCGSSSRKKSAGVLGIVTLGLNGGCNMAIAPTNKREADEMALKLFCLLAFILVGLITAGVL